MLPPTGPAVRALAKAHETARTAAEAVKRLKPLFKAAWQLRGHLPRLAGLAKESGRDPERYFWWLYGQRLKEAARQGQ